MFILDWLEGELDKEEFGQATSEPLTDRHHWILDQLRDGVKLTREMVQTQFQLGEKQAKRTLILLTSRRMIDFVRKPRPGYYILHSKTTHPRPRRPAALPGQATSAPLDAPRAESVLTIPFPGTRT